jgi:hypothetical protein
MHPNGQLPAYEWAFGDVNPPVHAWACWRVYKIEKRIRGVADRAFLERAFHKLLLNFTWWVNRKDAEGMNVFQGGFLGLDNIGVRIDFNILFTVHAANQHDPLEFVRFIRDELTWLAFRAAAVAPARSGRSRRLN